MSRIEKLIFGKKIAQPVSSPPAPSNLVKVDGDTAPPSF